jgi:hypothetical protein
MMIPDSGMIENGATFNQALSQFAAKVQALTQKTVDGRSYVLVDTLRDWMRETSPTKLDEESITNLELLLHAAYFGKQDFLPIESSYITRLGRDCCIVVFGILLDLGLGHLVDAFSRKGIVDARLPEDLSSLTKKLEDLEESVRRWQSGSTSGNGSSAQPSSVTT